MPWYGLYSVCFKVLFLLLSLGQVVNGLKHESNRSNIQFVKTLVGSLSKILIKRSLLLSYARKKTSCFLIYKMQTSFSGKFLLHKKFAAADVIRLLLLTRPLKKMQRSHAHVFQFHYLSLSIELQASAKLAVKVTAYQNKCRSFCLMINQMIRQAVSFNP